MKITTRVGLASCVVLGGVIIGGAMAGVLPMGSQKIIAAAVADSRCDLRQAPCISRLANGGTVQLDMEPRSLPPLRPLQVNVSVTNLDAHSVELDLRGVDMNMGENRTRLTEGERGRFSGSMVISVCTRSRMLWEARVLVHTDDGILAVPYRFETIKM